MLWLMRLETPLELPRRVLALAGTSGHLQAPISEQHAEKFSKKNYLQSFQAENKGEVNLVTHCWFCATFREGQKRASLGSLLIQMKVDAG